MADSELQLKKEQQQPTPLKDVTDIELPANMINDGLGKIWLTNSHGKVEKEKDGVVLIVDPKRMTVTARIASPSY